MRHPLVRPNRVQIKCKRCKQYFTHYVVVKLGKKKYCPKCIYIKRTRRAREKAREREKGGKMHWIWNPKTKGSGIITCIPQKRRCPNKCDDCFFQSGRSYLEPLAKNLPHIPPKRLTKGRIVRMNDGNDSNNNRVLVEKTAKKFDNYFFNTAIPHNLDEFSGPVVLTVNPGKMTDSSYYCVLSNNLMFVRIRVNAWNISSVVIPAVSFYTMRDTVVVLTFMAYYTKNIPSQFKHFYSWKKRTINSYYVLKDYKIAEIIKLFKNNPLVYSCGVKGEHSCTFCGNCIREYYNTKERMR